MKFLALGLFAFFLCFTAALVRSKHILKCASAVHSLEKPTLVGPGKNKLWLLQQNYYHNCTSNRVGSAIWQMRGILDGAALHAVSPFVSMDEAFFLMKIRWDERHQTKDTP